ncbi:MAG: metallophosphoesterase family protein [Chloroflexota bacterium]
MPVRFLHCGDLHLGHDYYGSEERAGDFARSFSHIVDTAMSRAVSFVIIAGDLFDRRNINAQTLNWVMPELERLRAAAIPVVAIEGNHDKAFFQDKMSWLEWLAQRGYLFLLKPSHDEGRMTLPLWDETLRRGACLDLPEARIYGLGYLGALTRHRLAECAELLPPAGDRLTILVLHAIVGRDALGDAAGLAPVQVEPLRDRVHYLALGHRHGRLDDGQWVYSPGAPEACDIAESDQEKGFYLVTAEGATLTAEFIPSVRRPSQRVAVDVSGAADAAAAVAMVRAAATRCAPAPQSMLQVAITGIVDWSPAGLDLPALRECLVADHDLLLAEVVNEINVTRGGEPGQLALARDKIERQVIEQLVRGHAPFAADTEAAANFVLQVRQLVAEGATGRDIAEAALALADALAGAAPGADGGEGGSR